MLRTGSLQPGKSGGHTPRPAASVAPQRGRGTDVACPISAVRPDPFLKEWIEHQVDMRIRKVVSEDELKACVKQVSTRDSAESRDQVEHKVLALTLTSEQLIAAFQNLADEIEVVKAAVRELDVMRVRSTEDLLSNTVTHEQLDRELAGVREQCDKFAISPGDVVEHVERLSMELGEQLGQRLQGEFAQLSGLHEEALVDMRSEVDSMVKVMGGNDWKEGLEHHVTEMSAALAEIQHEFREQVSVCRSDMEEEIAILQRQFASVSFDDQPWSADNDATRMSIASTVDSLGTVIQPASGVFTSSSKDTIHSGSFMNDAVRREQGSFSASRLDSLESERKVLPCRSGLSTATSAADAEKAAGDVRRAAPRTGPFPGRKISTSPRRVDAPWARLSTTSKEGKEKDAREGKDPVKEEELELPVSWTSPKNTRVLRLGGGRIAHGPLPQPSLLARAAINVPSLAGDAEVPTAADDGAELDVPI